MKLSSFAGKVVAINFVYTRCALPQFCLRMTNTFGVLQKRFASVLGRDAQLLTVTFDPERDTPEVLAAYASQWNADPRGWRFLTGSVDGGAPRLRAIWRGIVSRRGPAQPHGPHRASSDETAGFWPISKEIGLRRNNWAIYCDRRWSRSRGDETTLECAFAPRCSSRPESAGSILNAPPRDDLGGA